MICYVLWTLPAILQSKASCLSSIYIEKCRSFEQDCFLAFELLLLSTDFLNLDLQPVSLSFKASLTFCVLRFLLMTWLDCLNVLNTLDVGQASLSLPFGAYLQFMA